ncbi:hypothetical protein ACFWPA_05710 [Rhodococcus sp. NPDC058505]|uniref:DUF7373 family lipoprotein n=1 Tax=unclassified Rhodococcus (in: high G+C Gram-positive bacteria) TaxID=192944 RepID=UPI003664085E
MRLRGCKLIVAAAVTVGAVAGCGGTEATDPQSEETTATAETATAEVDPAALDTGDYPTDPAPAFGNATPEEVAPVDGQRMAEFVVAPWEVDPEFNDPTLPTFVVRNYKMLKGTLDESVYEVPANASSAIYGFVTSARTSTAGDRAGTERALTNLVMRYIDPAAAAAAAGQMAEASAARPGSTAVDIPGLPDSHGISSTAVAGEVELAAFTPHGEYVLYSWASAPQDRADEVEATLARIVELQGPLIDRFPRTPTRSQNGGERPQLEVDQNDILIYAIPAAADAPAGDADRGVYGPRGMSHFYASPAEMYRTLSKHGSEHNAIYKTTVYRASTPDDAAAMLTEFDGLSRSNGWTTIPSPAGLPNASCLTKTTQSADQYSCSVQVGRYIGEASGLDDRTDVYRQISAQYLILTKADQDAR